ncbi:MAG: WD40 repeat domain-containing protein [Syntrophales bacterium]
MKKPTPLPSLGLPPGDLVVHRELSTILSRYARGKRLNHRIDTGTASSVRAVKVSDDGCLITGDDRGTVRVWDTVTGKCRREFRATTGQVNVLATSSDGRYLATGGWPYPGHLDYVARIWDLRSGRQLHTLGGYKSAVTLVLFTADGGRVITASPCDETVKIWDLGTGVCRATLADKWKRFPAILSDIALTPDEKYLLAAHQGVARPLMWDLSTGSLLNHFGLTKRGIMVLRVTPDGERLVSGEDYGTIAVWDLKRGTLIRTMEGDGSTSMILSLAPAPDNRRLASVACDNRLRLWDLASGELLGILDGKEHQYRAVLFSRDGRRLFVTTGEGVSVHDGKTLAPLAALTNIRDGFLWTTSPDEHAPKGWFWTDREDLVRVVESAESGAGGPSLTVEEPVRRKYLRVYNNRKMVMLRFNDPDKYRLAAQRYAASLEAQADGSRQKVPALLPRWQGSDAE